MNSPNRPSPLARRAANPILIPEQIPFECWAVYVEFCLKENPE